jgi:hypothetical protein
MSTPFNEDYADVPVTKVGGDDFVMTLTYGSSVAGNTFDAAVTDAVTGLTLQAISAIATNEALGIVVLSLTAVQTLALVGKNMRWYYARTVSSVKRTELGGTFEVKRR